MKAKTILPLLAVAIIAGASGWFAARRLGHHHDEKPAQSGERKVRFYQSPMHPWITSDKPGRCTICGMQLEPVYEGERGFTTDEGVVALGSNIVQAIHVQTDVATNRPLVRTLRVAGIIDDDDTKHRRMSAYADGRVDKLFVNYVGAEVVMGQPLAVLYSPGLLVLESEYLALLNQKLPDGASDTLQQERARLMDAAVQRLKRLGYSDAQVATLASKKASDARTEILAPMTGTVVSRNVYEGQYVKEGDVLFEIADFSTMWFLFDGYERDLSWLRLGQEVEVSAPALPGKVFKAPITFIDPNLEAMTRSAKVRVELPNPIVEEGGRKGRLLYHQMYAEGVVKIGTPETLVVPRTAVLSAGEPVVYVEVGDGAYEQRKVKLGRRGDAFVEVLEGVKAGERVVTTGNLLIDAQAQLNAATLAAGMDSTRNPSEISMKENRILENVPVEFSEAQRQSARDFLKLTSDLGGGLAGDNLNQFNELAPQVHANIPKVLDAFGNVKPLRPALQKLEENGHLEKAKDLAAARKQFLLFSTATVDLVRQLRSIEPFKTVRIFNCPMVNRAIPGAAKNGAWIQLEPPLRNPYFGAAMLDCGTEVK